MMLRKKQFRIFFVFDSERKVILLIGGDKRGDKKFYNKMIPAADKLYDEYIRLKEVAHEKRKR